MVWITEIDGDNLVEFVDRNQNERQAVLHVLVAFGGTLVSPRYSRTLCSRTTAPEDRRKLGGGIVALDDQVGKLLDCLDKHKLRENTLLIFSSDNGANGGEGGSSTPYRGGKGKDTQQVGWTLSPTIISWPGVVPQGKRFDGFSCTLDFYATIASAAKASPQNISMVSI